MKLNGVRLTSTAGAGVVAGIAAWASWSHMVGVAMEVGEHSDIAHALPLSVDGLLVVASAAMVDDRRNGMKPRLSARIMFGVGVAASLAANIAHAQPTIGARIVAAWPALALLGVVELLSRRGKPIATSAVKTAPAKAAIEPSAAPAPASNRRGVATRKKVAKVAAKPVAKTHAQIAAAAGVSESTARRHVQAINNHQTPAEVPA